MKGQVLQVCVVTRVQQKCQARLIQHMQPGGLGALAYFPGKDPACGRQ